MGLALAKLIDKTIGTLLCYLLAFRKKLTSRNVVYNPDKVQRILIEKLIAIGDVIVALPSIHAIRQRFPHAHIALLVTPRVKAVVDGCPDVDEVIYYDVFGKEKALGGLLSIIRTLRTQKFDLVLELTHYHRIVSLITMMAGIPQRAGFSLPGQGRNKLLTIPVDYDTSKHEVEAFQDVARAVGVEKTESTLREIFVSEEDKQTVQQLLATKGVLKTQNSEPRTPNSLILIQPGTSGIALSRRWAPEKWATVANWLHKEVSQLGSRQSSVTSRQSKEPRTLNLEPRTLQIAFCGGKDEVPLFDEIKPHLDFEPLNFIGQLSLKQFAWLSKQAALFIGLDTGTTHLAAAMGTPVLALYGPNTPLKWGPYGDRHHVIYRGIHCSPCTKQYLGQVSKCKDNVCMQMITVEDVIDELKVMLPVKHFV